ncbi:MAG: DUF4011 domain-containing protein [Deltaproteobacteria bacterium]|nr:DUF4011 domain-containing protein [Deltaproteobacteria bacterium]
MEGDGFVPAERLHLQNGATTFSPSRASVTAGRSRADVAQILKTFRDRLLRIDKSNPSIKFRKVTQKSSFDLGGRLPHLSSALLTAIQRPNLNISLLPDRLLTEDADKSRENLRRLKRTADALAEETGKSNLFVGLAWLEGWLSKDFLVRAPLILIPAAVAHEQSGWFLSAAGEVTPNDALVRAVQKHCGVSIADQFRDEILGRLTDDDSVDGAKAFSQITSILAEAGIHVQARPYEPFDRIPDLKDETGCGAYGETPLALVSYSVLGIFRQSSTSLHADLEKLLGLAEQDDLGHPVVNKLLGFTDGGKERRNPASSTDVVNGIELDLDSIPDREFDGVVPSDPSQEAILVRAQSDDCTVVHGPPGTGKSQVIVNLIANAVGRGQRVLVCCQKRVALDVVYRRLHEVGLSGIAYILHDETTDRAGIYSKLTHVVETTTRGASTTSSTAALSLEIDDRIKAIRRITQPLHSQFHGTQLWEIYRKAKTGFRPYIRVPDDIIENVSALEKACALAKRLANGFDRFDRTASPVYLRKKWGSLSNNEKLLQLQQFERAIDLLRRAATTWNIHDDSQREQVVWAITVSDAIGLRWYRGFLPRWYRSKSIIANTKMCRPPVPFPEWRAAIERAEELKAAVRALSQFWEPQWIDGVLSALGDPPKAIETLQGTLAFVKKHFYDIQDYDLSIKEIGPLAPVFAECAARLKAGEDWSPQIEQTVLLGWIDEAENKHPDIRGNPLKNYERLRSELQQKLDEKLSVVAHNLVQEHRNKIIACHAGDASRWSKFVHELSKKRARKPLRALFSLYRPAVLSVAPCWLATPEAAAEVFPFEESVFDLVVFDEASQLTAERSLPVAFRGKRIVVAGDEEQMPPSHFFESMTADDDEEVDANNGIEGDIDRTEVRETLKADSLLSLAKRFAGTSALSWHYRSNHQELIEFSNQAFYGGGLQVGANVLCGAESAPPIRWMQVEGRWEDAVALPYTVDSARQRGFGTQNRRGKWNLVEAKIAVDIMADQLRSSAEESFRSIGIITFNIHQQAAIEQEIKRRKEMDGDFAAYYQEAEAKEQIDERPIVKNIENIQGDERDVIIFSVGYAPVLVKKKNKQGKVEERKELRLQFGPLSASGGENRLNVAITRAKEAVFVVCSFDPSFIPTDGDAAGRGKKSGLGRVRFRQYLEYAKAVSEKNTKVARKILADVNPAIQVGDQTAVKWFDSPLEEQIYEALVAKGLEVDTQVGLCGYRIDLAVRDPANPTRYCLGIECDGAKFHSGRSVRERDIARQRFLESKGWRIARIWSTTWWRDPDGEIRRICDVVRQLS